MATLIDDLWRDLDKQSVVLLILFDRLAAFSIINHGILLEELVGLVVDRTVFHWFRFFLSYRIQKVVLALAFSLWGASGVNVASHAF